MGGGIIGHNIFEEIIGLENLFLAWKEFKKGKTGNPDVQEFALYLEDNIFQLHEELKTRRYTHGTYTPFFIADPKLRHIHKASVRDRLLHHAVFRILYPMFDRNFIYDSYSCRVGKGTHRAVDRLERFIAKLSQNNSRLVYALKCDVRKYFDSISHDILTRFIDRKIEDEGARWLIGKILKSFSKSPGVGLPLGNVTSQLFANIYLNELDQFVKHNLKAKCYLRYCDDFIILGENKGHLFLLAKKINKFLFKSLKLSLHTNKIIIRKHRQGIDFLGYVVLPYHRVVRTKTRKRIIRKFIEKRNEFDNGLVSEGSLKQSLNSYLGILKYCNGYELENEMIWLSGWASIELTD